MWMLFIIITGTGLAHPIQIDGYASKKACEIAAADAVETLDDPGTVVRTWCAQDPWKG